MCKRINKADMKEYNNEIKACADTYSENYVPMYRKVARAAFMAGMVFDHMLKKGDITQDMICADFFRILDDGVFKAMEEDKA